MTTLAELGPRICIMGPSNSGKSTLAVAIARQRQLPAVHLDQLFHLPHSNWQPRPEADFLQLHDAAIQQPYWVMEGNYSRALPQRLQRATGFILLDLPTPTSLYRYFRRTWLEHARHGALAGNKDSVKWEMLHHIGVVTPRNRRSYAALFGSIELPKLRLGSPSELEAFYRAEALQR
ncbi:AAA family ATPase [Stenotrophomonas sp. UBA7606]|uniref:AAA family ATPase n=1 Tax=Stenotrophomonas sp. UBA7606 TaxID=1947559 RepID=UPI0025D3EC46|nr:AAA family ATPase [Stenotrophomonas sp. UBA7606]